MSHSPEQASQLWCPMSRVAQAGHVDIQVAYNRSLAKSHRPMKSIVANPDTFKLGEDPETETVFVLETRGATSMAANCVADKCAMWRWERNADTVLETEGDAAPVRGFCGIAGRPEVNS